MPLAAGANRCAKAGERARPRIAIRSQTGRRICATGASIKVESDRSRGHDPAP